jgi:hypothetical protein
MTDKNKPNTKSMKLVGTLLGEPRVSIAKSGAKYIKVPCRDLKTAEIWVLMVFKEAVEFVATLKVNDKVSISGKRSSGKDENIIFVDYVTNDDKSVGTHRTREETLKAQADLEKYYLGRNYCAVYLTEDETGKKRKHWFPKSWCIERSPNIWVRKIDYAMDLLGHAEVERRLRAKLLALGGGINIPSGKGEIIQQLISEMCEEVIF